MDKISLPSHGDDDGGFHEPFLLRNGSGNGVDPARIIRCSGQVTSKDGADQGEREYDEEANASDGHHSAKRDGARGVVVDGDKIDDLIAALRIIPDD